MTKTEMRVNELNEQARHNQVTEHNQKVGNVISGVTGVLGAISRPAAALISKKPDSPDKPVIEKVIKHVKKVFGKDSEGDEVENVKETTTNKFRR